MFHWVITPGPSDTGQACETTEFVVGINKALTATLAELAKL
jgi:hypothetical protein